MAHERYFDLVESVRRMAGNPGPRIQRTLHDAYGDVVDALRRENVRFLLHGAFALAAHGHERATKVVDLLVAVNPRTVRAVYAAMKELRGIPAQPAPRTADEALRRGARHVTFTLGGWLVDFFFDPEFDALLSRSVRKRFGDRVVDVISVRDLVERKAERATLQDLADIERLGGVEDGR